MATVVLGKLISDLLRRDLPFSEVHIVAMVGHARGLIQPPGVPMGAVVKNVEGFVRRFGLSDVVGQALGQLRRAFGPHPTRQEERKLQARLEALIGERRAGLDLKAGEPWADAVTVALSSMSDHTHAAWSRLLSHAQSAHGLW